MIPFALRFGQTPQTWSLLTATSAMLCPSPSPDATLESNDSRLRATASPLAANTDIRPRRVFLALRNSPAARRHRSGSPAGLCCESKK